MQQDDCRGVDEQGRLDHRPAVDGCLCERPSRKHLFTKAGMAGVEEQAPDFFVVEPVHDVMKDSFRGSGIDDDCLHVYGINVKTGQTIT